MTTVRKPAAKRSTRVEGTITVNPRGFGFLKFEIEGREESALIRARLLRPFVRGDRVRATVTPDRKGFVATRLTLHERPTATQFGVLTEDGDGFALVLDPDVSNHPWPVLEDPDGVSDREIKIGAPYIARLQDDGVVLRRRIPAEEFEVARLRARHNVPHEFPRGVLTAAKRAKLKKDAQRRDLRDLPTLTIDSPSSMDLDDALSVLPADSTGGVRVLVSIADVDGVVRAGSSLDGEARSRATSVYFRSAVTPMLPRRLSENALSVLPQQDRPAVTAELRIDPEGEITSVDLYTSLIRSNARLSYERASEYLERTSVSEADPTILELMRWLRVASARLAAARAARGGFQLDRSETTFEFDKSGRPVNVKPRTQNSANLLIERLMVAANESVARWLTDRGLPAVYRVHDAPDAGRVERVIRTSRNFGFEVGLSGEITPRSLAALEAQFRGTEIEAAMRDALGSLLGPARYTTEAGAHFGLGSPLYLHFTSPIRRYADLAVHRVVKRHLAGGRNQDRDADALTALCDHLNERTRSAKKAEREHVRTLSARVLSDRIGERYNGSVVSVKPFGLVVYLHDLGVTGVVPLESFGSGARVDDLALHPPKGKHLEVGDFLAVRIKAVDEKQARIDFEPL
ncbi:MAG: ribonuclease R family protein [Myxococcota bacterium]